MNWDFTPYSTFLHLAAIISVCVALVLTRRRRSPGSISLVILMFAVAEWAFASGMEAASVGLSQKILWSKIEYFGAVTAPSLFMIFTLEYCQLTRFLSSRYLLFYSLVPLAAIIVTMTNEWHGLIWNSYTPSLTEPNYFIFGHGTGYYLLIAYDYVVIMIGLAIMVHAWFQSKKPYRQHISIILASAIFPITSGLVYTLGLDFFPGFDITPISFLITGLILALGVFQFRLFDLAPVARHILIENMNDGILVLDADDRVADINPVAENIIADSADNVLGQPISEVLKSWSTLLTSIKEAGDYQTEILSREDPPRYYALQVKPLYNGSKALLGRLFAFRDVTSYRHTENQLARQNEELRIIERINLAIAGGLDIEQTIKTLHEQCCHVAPIDLFYVALSRLYPFAH